MQLWTPSPPLPAPRSAFEHFGLSSADGQRPSQPLTLQQAHLHARARASWKASRGEESRGGGERGRRGEEGRRGEGGKCLVPFSQLPGGLSSGFEEKQRDWEQESEVASLLLRGATLTARRPGAWESQPGAVRASCSCL